MAAPRVRAGGPVSDLRLERMSRGLLLAQVAEKVGISTALLSLVERGEQSPSPDVLARLRRFYARRAPEVQRIA